MKFIALFALAFVLSFPAHAQIKDSYYYMRDDGVQSPEEMQMEAQTVYETCRSNIYKSRYFNCQCLAGAFLIQREKLGGIAPQEEIINELTIGKKASCANTVVIAGTVYRECMQSSRYFREFAKDNEEYCSCVGNTTARQFEKDPFLNTSYISDVQSQAMLRCHSRDERGNPLPGQN